MWVCDRECLGFYLFYSTCVFFIDCEWDWWCIYLVLLCVCDVWIILVWVNICVMVLSYVDCIFLWLVNINSVWFRRFVLGWGLKLFLWLFVMLIIGIFLWVLWVYFFYVFVLIFLIICLLCVLWWLWCRLKFLFVTRSIFVVVVFVTFFFCLLLVLCLIFLGMVCMKILCFFYNFLNLFVLCVWWDSDSRRRRSVFERFVFVSVLVLCLFFIVWIGFMCMDMILLF